MAQAIPGARFALIPGAGHLTPVEQPELVLTELREFLQSIG
jgi:pimeloyl-ACP methyl ester carboxylesterase